ncbi:MAG: 30S ribosomal protein S12 methylthiotransferase RimO [Oscillospiraceae bacterium]|jgi:ribosomal protein S12 methylthiotransferase|nr:30S ribosomal protein S12 methylthiotransferase RimO [Oscillospiraceae bacterium]
MIGLGCSKNQVDAERLLFTLREAGFEISGDLEECDAVVINTCGFIEDAKRESIEAVLEMGSEKKKGKLKGIVVTGCLPERYQEEFARELPEAGGVLGIGKNSEIALAVEKAIAGERHVAFGPKEDLCLKGGRILTTPGYYAYLKLAEGCDNRCGYCAIPLIRGRFRSARMEDLVDEAKALAAGGVRELNLVAQDTSRYGEDLYGKGMLPELLARLGDIEGIRWLRVLYCYPDRVTDELLAVIQREPKVVKYMDLPLQHASGKILSAMNRSGGRESLLKLIARIRERVPGITLRTTLIAGFPGETEEDFAELCGFVKEARFDRLGCFAYSREENTPAFELPGQIDEETKRRRAEVVMETQAPIAEELARARAGKIQEILTEGFDSERGLFYGRGQGDAPDIDTRVYFSSAKSPEPGEFASVLITGSDGYDLTGETASGGEKP